MSRIARFNDADIDVTSFTDIASERETLEFRTVRADRGDIEIFISQPDDQPDRLYLSVNGEVDTEYAAWAIEYARHWFKR